MLISIIIPIYNNRTYLLEALNSVLNQSYKNIECLVIDDGSTDGSLDILTPYIERNLIKYFYQENKGVSSARNLGIEKSNGNYLIFLDADDLLVNNALQFLISKIDENDIVFGAWEDFNHDLIKINLYENYKGENQLIKYLIHKPTVSTALIKKSHIIKWDESLKVWEVTDYFLNLILSNAKIIFTDKVVTRIRQHNNPNRASFLQNHFNPLQTLSFLKKWKENIKNKQMLTYEVEAVIDTEIVNNIYSALRNNVNPALLTSFFSIINIKNIKNSLSYKKYGLLFFIFHIKTFHSILLFKKLNKLLGRI